MKQQGYEDSEKNTKIWSDDAKNREEQSQQQADEGNKTRERNQTIEKQRIDDTPVVPNEPTDHV